jgi:3',5'-cyclic AMP phosphodiesterase CpdA
MHFNNRDRMKLTGLALAVISLCSCMNTSSMKRNQQAFSFVQLCDTQLGMGGYEHDKKMFGQAVEQINALNPDFVFICGDLVHDRNDQSFADFKTIRDGLRVPCYCAAGNHDVGNQPSPESLARYRAVIGDDYYAVEHKGYTFVCVNTQLWKAPLEGESEKQDAWLRKTLNAAAKKNSPIFIVGHYPLFLENPDEPEEYMNLPIDKRRELLSLYEQSGVVAVLGGHTHRLIINDYKGIQLVNAETTSKNFDQRPMGFRLWHISETGEARHEFITVSKEAVGVDE